MTDAVILPTSFPVLILDCATLLVTGRGAGFAVRFSPLLLLLLRKDAELTFTVEFLQNTNSHRVTLTAKMASKAIPSHLRAPNPDSRGPEEGRTAARHHGKSQSHMVSAHPLLSAPVESFLILHRCTVLEYWITNIFCMLIIHCLSWSKETKRYRS